MRSIDLGRPVAAVHLLPSAVLRHHSRLSFFGFGVVQQEGMLRFGRLAGFTLLVDQGVLLLLVHLFVFALLRALLLLALLEGEDVAGLGYGSSWVASQQVTLRS